MHRYRDILGTINYGLFLTMVAALPFPQICLRYTFVAWIIAWFLEARWLQKIHSTFNFQLSTFILFALWFLWKIVSGLWAPDAAAWQTQIERYTAFALMLPVGIWGVNEKYNWRTAGYVLIASCVVAVPFYIAWMTALYIHPEWVHHFTIHGQWTYEGNWWVFFSDNISQFKHRLFLCSIELFACVLAFQLLHQRLALFVPTLLILFATVPLTGSRQMILTCAALLVIAGIYALPHGKRMKYGLLIAAIGVGVGGATLAFHPRMQEFNQEPDIRLKIWETALEEPSDYLVYGLGAGQSTDYLVEKYCEKEMSIAEKKRYHCHNQYLQECMEIGLGGALLFLLAWLSIPFSTQGRARRTAIYLTTLFMLNMCTDCMFGMFDGVLLWAVGMVFILLQRDLTTADQSLPLPAA